eukprot:240423_1
MLRAVLSMIVLYSLFIFVGCNVAVEYFVSKYGVSHKHCGAETNPCGSLYGTSLNIENMSLSEEFIINVFDGQNETEMIRYKNNPNNHNPCLPVTFSETKQIHITFNASIITDFSTWFPPNICFGPYSNEYMFDGAKTLSLNNLVVNNARINIGVIRSKYDNTTIACYNCTFINVSATTIHALFHTHSSVYFVDTIFNTITTLQNIVHADHILEKSQDNAERIITIQRSSFNNINAQQSLLNLERSGNDFEHPVTMMLSDCVFHNISGRFSIINDGTYRTNVNMTNIAINVTTGSIYHSKHVGPSFINMTNISISTAQLLSSDYCLVKYALFHFATLDKSIIKDINILYTFDANKSCHVQDANKSVIYNNAINASCLQLYCTNPIATISNFGQIKVHNITIDIAISSEQRSNSQGQFIQYKYEYADDDTALIQNRNTMEITNMVIKKSMCDNLIFNGGVLTVTNLSFIPVNDIDFNPNSLQSETTIYQSGDHWAELFVYNSHFVGSRNQIYAIAGQVEIVDSVLEKASKAVYIQYGTHFLMNNCKIQHVGLYYGVFVWSEYGDVYKTSGVQILNSQFINVFNNVFKSYDPQGLLYITNTENISLANNTFNVNTSQLFYNISAQNIGFKIGFSPLTMLSNINARVVSNYFGENTLEPTTPWIYVYFNLGLNCMSGNIWNNYALNVQGTNITSCLRPELVHYLNEGVENQLYGYINETLFNIFSYFIIDAQSNIDVVVELNQSNLALDNINFEVTNQNETNNGLYSIIYQGQDSNLFLVDSYVTKNDNISYDISYNEDECQVKYNDRLSTDKQFISALWIHCHDTLNPTIYSIKSKLNQTMNSNNTKLVDHLSITKLNFTTLTSNNSYYPGDLIKFQYHVTDRLDTVFSYNFTDKLTVNLTFKTFTATTEIEVTGCPICENGLLINDVSLSDNIGEQYTINISVENKLFIPTNPSLLVNIIGCAIGYSPDHHNFTCVICNTGYYNLKSNNVKDCLNCRPKKNTGIECIGGQINVAENHWVGFDENGLKSAQCPSKYCCSQKNCNYINDKEALSAQNRDYHSVLCSQCKKGFSESIRSVNCVECKQRIYWEYLSFPFGIATLWTAYFLIISSDASQSNQNTDRKCCKCTCGKMKPELFKDKDILSWFKTIINRNILYYEQALSQVLAYGSYLVLLSVFAQIFNFSFVGNSSNGTSWCFIDGLTAKQKILLDLLVPFMVLLLMITIHSITKCFGCKTLCRKRKLNFGQAFMSMILFMIGGIISVLLRLLNCQKIGNYSVHFYFGENCYGETYYGSLLALICIIAAFTLMFFRLRNIGVSCENENSAAVLNDENSVLNTFVSKYKPAYYYWEYIIFIRRLLISIFSVSENDTTFQSLLVPIMLCFLVSHVRCKPFIFDEANRMEAILLSSIIFIVVLNLSHSGYIDPWFKNYVISFLIVLPFILIIHYFYVFIKPQRDIREQDLSHSDIDYHVLENNDNDPVNDLLKLPTENKDDGQENNSKSGKQIRKTSRSVFSVISVNSKLTSMNDESQTD